MSPRSFSPIPGRAAALCAAVLLAAAAPDELSLAPRQGVLLLNNGELIAGTITVAGDRYDVDLKDAQIFIKRAEVARFCRDNHECYLHRRGGIEEGRAQDHLELAEWCLRNGLLDEAETEIDAARKADRDHPKIRLLEPRLKLAREAPPAPAAATAAEKAVSSEQLDNLVRNLPPGSMESFTNTVQPMLLNHCTRSGCHGPRSTNLLKLERIAPNRLAGRHPTQRNLQAALALVDREHPEESKLLLATMRPHGPLKMPIFTEREQSQFRQLAQWVYLVAGVKEPAARPTLEERSAPLMQAIPRRAQPGEVVPASANEPPQPGGQPTEEASSGDRSGPFADQAGPHGERRSTGAPLRVANMNAPVAAKKPLKQGEPTKDEFVPKDPFDPEIFNRQFLGR